MNAPSSPNAELPASLLETAALWLARRDRGLSAAEQDEYLRWLAADPRHQEALARHAAALERMMQLYEWTPAHDTQPNPELFAPVSVARRRRVFVWAAAAAAAAAVVTVALVWPVRDRANAPSAASPATPVASSHLRVNERLALPDGTRVELKDGSRLQVQYSVKERRVTLVGGEAQFMVWKDKTRPFIVSVGGVEVRAVGTAFDVHLDGDHVKVLVTEGRVSVEQVARHDHPAPAFVSVGQEAVVPVSTGQAPVVAAVSAEEISAQLAWQAPRLQFDETPLSEAIEEFNRLNHHRIVLGDPTLGQVRLTGNFRPDNVEGFIRQLEPTVGIRGVRQDEDDGVTVLWRAHDTR